MHRRVLTSWGCVESLLVETFLDQDEIQGRLQLQLQQQIQLQLQLELTYTYNCHYSYNCNSRGSFIFNYSCKYLRLGLAWLVSSLHRPQTRYDLVPRAATMGMHEDPLDEETWGSTPNSSNPSASEDDSGEEKEEEEQEQEEEDEEEEEVKQEEGEQKEEKEQEEEKEE